MFLIQKIIVHVSRCVGKFERESVFVIGRCYHVLTRVYFYWSKVKLYSDPATEESKQAFLMTTTRGVGKVPTNPAVLGPRG